MSKETNSFNSIESMDLNNKGRALEIFLSRLKNSLVKIPFAKTILVSVIVKDSMYINEALDLFNILKDEIDIDEVIFLEGVFIEPMQEEALTVRYAVSF